MVQGHKGETEMWRLWVRYPRERINYYFLIFSFLRSGIKSKVRRWFPPLNTQYIEKFFGKWGTECLHHYVPSAYCAVYGIQRESEYIFISSLWCRSKMRCWFRPLNRQCLQISASSEEWSVLTLGSLCLPCCMRDTARSWFDLIVLYHIRFL